MGFHETRFDKLPLDIISGARTNTFHGCGVVRAAEGQHDEEPAPSEVEPREEVCDNDNLASIRPVSGKEENDQFQHTTTMIAAL